MAIFHLNAKIISRGKGQSAIAAAAYRSGERLRDEQADEQKYYTSRAERIVFTEIMAPPGAPEWAHDRNQLWNQAERAEKRKDAQLAREIEISLPHELTAQQREWLVKDFAREAFVRKGYAVDIAIHAPDKESDERNHHAHLMVTRRVLEAEGFAATKDWKLDKAQLGQWREQWAHLANRHLERHGHEARIDHRSLKEQGVEREPTAHLGYAAHEMAQRGAASDRMDALRAIMARNEIRADMKALEAGLKALEREASAQARPLAGADRATQTTARESATPTPATVPIAIIEARHQAAEAERRQAETERQRQKDMAELARADRADAKKLRDPAPGAPPSFEHAAGAAAREQAAALRQQRRDAWQDKAQEDWRKGVAARNPDRVRPAQAGLRVVDRATGAASSVADFVTNLLAGSSPPPRSDAQADMRAFVTDPEARKRQQLVRLSAGRQAILSERAVEDIRRDIEAGRDLKPEDVANLTRAHQEQIAARGDAYVRQMVEDARRRDERAGKGDGRERERD